MNEQKDSAASINVRRAERSDIPALVRFNSSMALETEDLALDPETLRKGVSKVFDNESKGMYFVAEEGRHVKASLLITKEWSDWRNAWWWWIQSVYVEKDARRKGLFRLMYDSVRALAEKDGAAGLRLYVDRTNTNAQKVYVNCGMSESHYLFFEEEFK